MSLPLGTTTMKKVNTCVICDSPVDPGIALCADCKHEILNHSWILECDCEHDNCMSICRDCIMNGKTKEQWKIVLEELGQIVYE